MLEPLVFQIETHKNIIEQCSSGAVILSPAQQAYHRDLIANNESQVLPYRTANLTPVDLINKKIKTLLPPGHLMFTNWQEVHYGSKHSDFAGGFHLELERSWFKKHDISPMDLEGSLHLVSKQN